ncbi:MAG: polyprenol monophosphomannose synthase [Candidatus Hecatellales archaeon]|nr:MAG: polyprenol monophosphomannose synthase [Candidatus Hecatellales archaeon]
MNLKYGESYRKKNVCVVIPTYNERENIVSLVSSVKRVLDGCGVNPFIVVVDDNSPDGTGKILDDLSKKMGCLYVLHRKSRMGLGSACREGFRYAIEKLNSEILVQMDADASHNPSYIPRFLDKIAEGNEVVVGSRNILGGGIVGWGFKRRMVSLIANKIARKVCGLTVTDTTSGYKAFTAKAIKKISQKTNSKGFDFQVETLFWAKKHGFKIAEVPIVFVDRREGKSKLTLKEIFRFLYTCLILFTKRFS